MANWGGQAEETKQPIVVPLPVEMNLQEQIEAHSMALHETFAPKIAELKGRVDSFVITSEVDLKAAIDFCGKIKTVTKELETGRKAIVDDPGQFVRAINKKVSGLKAPFVEMDSSMRRKITVFQVALQKKRDDEFRKQKQAAEELKKRLEAETPKDRKDYEPLPAAFDLPIVREPETSVRGDSGTSAHVRKNWTFEVVDIGAVPPEYLEVVAPKINAAIKGGIRNIPGLRIYEAESIVIR